MPDLLLDPGHGDPHAWGHHATHGYCRRCGARRAGLVEGALTWELALAVERALSCADPTERPRWEMTRQAASECPSVAERVRLADEAGAPLLSLHFNVAGEGEDVPKVRGPRVIYPGGHPLSALAVSLAAHLCAAYPGGYSMDRALCPLASLPAATRRRCRVVSKPKAGGVIVEACFLSCRRDREWLMSAGMGALGTAIATGVLEWHAGRCG